MKKLLMFLMAGLLLLAIGCQKDSWFDKVNPVKDELIFRSNGIPEVEINNGIAWLVGHQNPDGSFGIYEKVAITGFAVTKLCDWTVENESNDPLDPSGPYYQNIVDGLNYIFLQAHQKVAPDKYVLNHLWPNYSHETYNSAVGLMAIAATKNPNAVVPALGSAVDGLTYQQVAQYLVNFFIHSQNPDGGWRYYAQPQASDQSNTGFVVLGLTAAENFGCTMSGEMKSKLSGYIDYTQNDVNGDMNDGGCGYTDDSYWVNTLKTGNLLFEMAFVGDDMGDQRAQDALDYIERHWNDPGGIGNPGDYGWEGQYLAMYCLMKGFLAMGIEQVDPAGPVGLTSWYEAFKADILPDQLADGSWPSNPRWLGNPIESTVINLLTLEKFAPLPLVEVYLDIKPGSCPNPLNLKSKGVLPLAILGTADFDIAEIDPATVTLEGVSPVNWHTEDVSTPVNDPQSDCECNTAGPDGYMDYHFHFSTPELVTSAPALAGVEDGDLVPMTISGQLISGQSFEGVDCVLVLKKGK